LILRNEDEVDMFERLFYALSEDQFDLKNTKIRHALKFKRRIDIKDLIENFVSKYTLKSTGFVFDLYFQVLRKLFS